MALKEITREGASTLSTMARPARSMCLCSSPATMRSHHVLGRWQAGHVFRELGLSFEILVFDDCPRTAPSNVVREYQRAHPAVPIRLFVNSVNRGIARNFIEGAFHAAPGRTIAWLCGDDVEAG